MHLKSIVDVCLGVSEPQLQILEGLSRFWDFCLHVDIMKVSLISFVMLELKNAIYKIQQQCVFSEIPSLLL